MNCAMSGRRAKDIEEKYGCDIDDCYDCKVITCPEKDSNRIMSGGYSTAVSREEGIAMQLATKGICESGNYSIQPVNVGDYSLFTVKYRTSPVSPIFDDLSTAIKEFIKLTGE